MHQSEVKNSSGSSVTIVSGLNNSQGSVDELLGSSVSSRLSDTTIRSSNSVTPQGSFAQESGILTPTSLPLPPSPTVMSAPDPSSVPIPNFRSSPRGETIPQSSVKEPVVNSETEAVVCSSVIQNLENGSSGSSGTALKDRSATGSPVGRQVDVEASVDDEAKDEGDEELPESQKPEAEIQEEINERERKSSSGSSTSESLRPLSARAAEGNLIILEDNVKGKEDDVQADGEDAFTDDRLMEQWEMTVDDEAVPTGRESPESAHALPVSTPVMPSTRRKQPSIHTRYQLNPLNPKSDQLLFSPNNISTFP